MRDLYEIGGLLADCVTAAAFHHMKAFRTNEESMRPEHRFQLADGRMIVRDDFGRQLIQADYARYAIAVAMLLAWLAYFYWPRKLER